MHHIFYLPYTVTTKNLPEIRFLFNKDVFMPQPQKQTQVIREIANRKRKLPPRLLVK